MHLRIPRLLPITIMTMSALLALKSVMLVQAAAQSSGSARAAEPPSAAAGESKPDASGSTGPVQAAKVIPPLGASMQSGQPPASAQPASMPLVMSDTERAVLLALRSRRDTLDARARMLDQRAAELHAADQRLEDRVQQLSALQARLEGLETDRRNHRAENWAGLVKTYEAMKPRDAAAIFDALDMQVLLQVLDRMQERRAAPVLAAMQPDRARLVTQLLAEMRTRATAPPDGAPVPAAPKG